MTFTKDEEMMLLLYGEDTKEGFLNNIRSMQAQLQPDERKLNRLADAVFRKVQSMTEEEYRKVVNKF